MGSLVFQILRIFSVSLCQCLNCEKWTKRGSSNRQSVGGSGTGSHNGETGVN